MKTKFSFALALLFTLAPMVTWGNNVDPHFQKLVLCLNTGDFDCAKEELPSVHDWTYDATDSIYRGNINQFLSFIQTLDSLALQAKGVDSLINYVAKDAEEYGQMYLRQGYLDAGLQHIQLAADLKSFVFGEYSLEFAKLVNSLGVINYYKNNDSIAEFYYHYALQIYDSITNGHDPDYANLLNNLGMIYYKKGDFLASTQYLYRAIEILEITWGKHHIDYVNSLDNLAQIYYYIGDLPKAIECFEKALVGIEPIYTQYEDYYAKLLNNAGTAYGESKMFDKSEQCYVNSFKIREKLYKDDSFDYALAIYNLGIFYEDIGNHNKALHLFHSLLNKWNDEWATRGLHKEMLYNVTGAIYAATNDTINAKLSYVMALEIIEEKGEEQSANYAQTLHNLGLLYKEMHHYEQAEHYYQQALTIRKNILGTSHPDYATSLNNLGVVYIRMKDYAKAEQYLSEALAILKSSMGENHPHCAHSYQNLLGACYKGGLYEKAAEYFYAANELYGKILMRAFNYMSETQRDSYWKEYNQAYEKVFPSYFYTVYRENAKMAALAFNNELFLKGLLLNTSQAVQHSILESGDTALIRQWKQLIELKNVINHFQEQNISYLPEYEQQAEALEKAITKASAAYRENHAIGQITWDGVKSHLKAKEIAIEFMSVPLSEDSTMYCALLLRKNSKYPELIPLFEEKEALSMWDMSDDWSTNDMYSEDTNGRKFSELVWSKLLPYIKKGETVYFAATGILHQLAIEALPYDEKHSMADMFNLVRVSSTREIVTRHDHSDNTTAVLYGGIQYDVTADTLLAQSQQYATMSLLASRGIDNDTTNRGTVDYLPGTKIEADSIQQILEKSNVQVQLFTSTNANEESFKALSGTHQNILHIGTHGFFWTDSTAQKKDYFSQRMIGMDNTMSAPPTIDPLNRCGLLFAGANLAMQGHSAELPEGVQDGILTAKEISLLDLRDADLVVLSACETGKGEITGDGVFGLQRAFKMAGARTIIMSLWPVSDQATQLFMTEFFRHWITDGLPKREAFRKAQNQVRQAYGEPIYWAGFIMLD